MWCGGQLISKFETIQQCISCLLSRKYLDIGDDGRSDEVALLVVGHGEAAAVEQQSGALFLARLDDALDARLRLLANNWTTKQQQQQHLRVNLLFDHFLLLLLFSYPVRRLCRARGRR